MGIWNDTLSEYDSEEIRIKRKRVRKPSKGQILVKLLGLTGRGILYLAGKRSSKPKRSTPLDPHSRESVMNWLLE